MIVTLTSANEPVFSGRDVKPGTFVILAGANKPQAREADDALIARSTIHVDHRDGCMTRAGDLCIPLASGVLKPEQIAGEIGLACSATAAPTQTVARCYRVQIDWHHRAGHHTGVRALPTRAGAWRRPRFRRRSLERRLGSCRHAAGGVMSTLPARERHGPDARSE